MTIRTFSRDELDSEPHSVRFKDLYPWDAIAETPFGASLAVIEPGGRTMLHGHDPAETFVICRGRGTMRIDDVLTEVGPGDVVYLKPRCIHDLTNASATEDLVFVSVFWDAPVGTRVTATPKLILPSPPTPNGPLHLGHLAGPYVLADTLRRYYRARGIDATLACIIDEHQSYVADRAWHEKRDPHELAAGFSDAIAETFDKFHARPDVAIRPTRDPAYRAAIQALFAKLSLESHTTNALYCEPCAMWLYDSFVAGGCPQCGERSYGFACDACCALVDPALLRGPHCERCGGAPVIREATRLVLPVAPFRDRLADHHRTVQLSPKLRRFAAQWLDQDLALPATQLGTWGIPAGLDGQIISPWFEIALATSHLHTADADIVCCFGVDNAFLYLIHDPVVALALDPAAKLPIALAANEFLLLDGAKMSTSRSHAIGATAILGAAPADLIRLYVAKIRPEDTPSSTNLQGATLFVNFIARSWMDWLERLGKDLVDGRAPAASNPSLMPWSSEQAQFRARLETLAARARQGYEDMMLREVAAALIELVERAHAFGAAQQHLAGVDKLAQQRETGLALELSAVRTLAILAAPLMPLFAAQLWAILGYRGAIEFFDEVGPVPADQPIVTAALINRSLFPAWIPLG